VHVRHCVNKVHRPAEDPPYSTVMQRRRREQDVPGAGAAVLNRTWTISSHPAESAASNTFAITVKRAGLVTAYMHRRAAGPGRRACRWPGNRCRL